MDKSQFAKKLVEPSFQTELLKEPRQTLEKLGMMIPENTQVKVVRNSASEVNVVIPQLNTSNKVIDDSDLVQAAAGEIIVFVGTLAVLAGFGGAITTATVATLFATDVLSFD